MMGPDPTPGAVAEPRKSLRLLLGGVVVDFHAPPGPTLLAPGGAYQAFVSAEAAEVGVQVHLGPAPQAADMRVAFDAKAWQYAVGSGCTMVRGVLSQLGEPRGAYTLLLRPESSDRMDLYLENPRMNGDILALPIPPFDEILAVHLLAGGRGLLLHACGLEWDGRGLLFSGVSGQGKSTTAGLWSQHAPGALIYSDERVPVRPAADGSGFDIHTSFWLSRAASAAYNAARSTRLERIYLIQHAPQNYAAPLPVAEAVRRILQRTFLPFWLPDGMAYSLKTVEALCSQVPCFELGFVPDGSVVEFVMGHGTRRHGAQPQG